MLKYFVYASAAAMILAITAPAANAYEVYCRVNNRILVNDGDTAVVDWTVVASGVRTSSIPGRPPTTGCDFNWHGLGEIYKPIDFIEKPKLGEAVNSPRYRVFYKSTKLGDDEFAVRLYWLDGRNGRPSSAVVKYVVHVVDHAL